MNKPKARSANRVQRSRQTQVSLAGLLVTLLVAAITWWNGGQTPFSGLTPPVTITTDAINDAQVQPVAKPPTAPPPTEVKAEDRATATPTQAPTTTRTKRPKASTPSEATAAVTPTKQPATAPTPTPPQSSRVSGLPTIAVARLPPEAHETIALIDQGGPFPFAKDGSTFQNREGLLPRKPRGYYQEYTVITPGEDDRGARRIVAGEAGELYYTDDHYESFREIVR